MDDGEQLEGLALAGSLGDLRLVIAHLPPGTTPYGNIAARALAAILARATAAELIYFESYGRKQYSDWTGWGRLRPSGVAGLPASVQRLATFHASGHVREHAVAALSARDDESDVPFLLLRMNDWVTPVAIRAATAIAARIDGSHAPAFVRWLGLLAHLRNVRRRDVRGPVRAIDALLGSLPARDALRSGLRIGSRDVRRHCVDVAAELPDAEAVPLLVEATGDRDPLVAAQATGVLAARLHGPALRTVLAPLVGHAFAAVRLPALRALCADDTGDLEPLLSRALLDSSSAIGELARYELRRRRNDSACGVYANALVTSRGPALVAALRGIGECGSEEHAPLVVAFFAHPFARVRAVAVKAIVRLALDANIPTIFGALQDPSPRVVRAAYDALRGKAHLLDRPTLLGLLDGSASARSACSALALLCEGDVWVAMDVALRAVRSQMPAVGAAAQAQLERLLQKRTYVRPPDLAALESSARAAKEFLPDRLQRLLHDALAAARRMR